jgi:hypothetical protein
MSRSAVRLARLTKEEERMTVLSPDEQASIEMMPTWEGLAPVKTFTEAMSQFVRQELSKDAVFDAAGMTAANRLCNEFRNEIWPHRIPTVWELVLADRAGRLSEKVAELNAAFLKERE